MVRRARLRTGPGAVAGGAASRELPAVPAAPEARQLLGRAGHGEAQKPAVQQLAASSVSARAHRMKPTQSLLRHQPPRPALDLALLPALSAPLLSRVRAGPDGDVGRPAAVVERRRGEAGDLRLRARDHRPLVSELCRPGGPHRRVRPGRHALGRASDVHAGDLLPRPRAGRGGEEAGAQEERAFQDRAVGQPGGDRQAPDAGPL